MTKQSKASTSRSTAQESSKTAAKQPDKAAIKAAVDEAKSLIKEGRPKIIAATAIYGRLRDESKEVVLAAFVEGASLTEKGALTYWYNCRRNAAKAKP